MKIGIPWKPSLVSIALREFFDIIERRFYEFRERERERVGNWGGEKPWMKKAIFFFFLLEEELERVRKRSSCCCSEQSTQICHSGFFILWLCWRWWLWKRFTHLCARYLVEARIRPAELVHNPTPWQFIIQPRLLNVQVTILDSNPIRCNVGLIMMPKPISPIL